MKGKVTIWKESDTLVDRAEMTFEEGKALAIKKAKEMSHPGRIASVDLEFAGAGTFRTMKVWADGETCEF